MSGDINLIRLTCRSSRLPISELDRRHVHVTEIFTLPVFSAAMNIRKILTSIFP